MGNSVDDTLGPLVLVVDDEPLLRSLVARILSRRGFRVIEAINGKQALDLLTSGSLPAVIVTDLCMPVMDGWRLLTELRDNPRFASIPTVVVSAAVDEAAERLATEVLPKPFNAAHLADIVRAHAEVVQRRLRRAPLLLRTEASFPKWWSAP